MTWFQRGVGYKRPWFYTVWVIWFGSQIQYSGIVCCKPFSELGSAFAWSLESKCADSALGMVKARLKDNLATILVDRFEATT